MNPLIQVCAGVLGSDRKGALQSRPGTDYFERDCLKDESNPVFNAVRQPEGDDLFGPSMGSGMATLDLFYSFFSADQSSSFLIEKDTVL